MRRGSGRSGVHVSEETALRHSSVWACLSAIAEALTFMNLYEQATTGANVRTRRDLPSVFHQPTPELPWEWWIWQQAWSLGQHGRCYGWVSSLDRDGYPRSVEPLDDSQVRWRLDSRHRWVTEVRHGDRWKEEDRWPLGRLWHVPLYPTPAAPMGLSPIRHHAETIGVGIAARDFGAGFFGEGAHPTAVFQGAKNPGSANAERIKERIKDATQGSREPLLLPEGWSLTPWQIAPDDSQFLDTMRYSGEDVCRVFGVPPGRVGLAISGQNVTYTNTSDANSDWRVSGLSRYLSMLQAGLSAWLPAGNRRLARFDFRAFLRADIKTRAEAYRIFAEIGKATGTPVMLTNEMRAEEGLAPLEGGDSFQPVQTPTKKEQA